MKFKLTDGRNWCKQVVGGIKLTVVLTLYVISALAISCVTLIPWADLMFVDGIELVLSLMANLALNFIMFSILFSK